MAGKSAAVARRIWGIMESSKGRMCCTTWRAARKKKPATLRPPAIDASNWNESSDRHRTVDREVGDRATVVDGLKLDRQAKRAMRLVLVRAGHVILTRVLVVLLHEALAGGAVAPG